MRDALKNYLTLASGLTEVGRQRAVAAAKALVAQGEASAEQVGALADDLVQTSKANRDMITTLVRTEVERAMAAVGVATADSVEFLTKRLQQLEASLREATAEAAGAAGTAAGAGTGGDPTSTHEMAEPAKQAAAKTAKPAKAAKAGAGSAAKPAKKAAANGAGDAAAKPGGKPAAAATAAKPAKKPAKKAQS